MINIGNFVIVICCLAIRWLVIVRWAIVGLGKVGLVFLVSFCRLFLVVFPFLLFIIWILVVLRHLGLIFWIVVNLLCLLCFYGGCLKMVAIAFWGGGRGTKDRNFHLNRLVEIKLSLCCLYYYFVKIFGRIYYFKHLVN